MRHSAYILTFIFLTIAGAARAQTMPERYSFDTDIHAIRHACIPGFHNSFDDYLQYAPAGLAVGLKAAGYESRSSWTRMLVSDAFSVGIMAATVNGIKYTVSRPRPDGSQNNSFPSGHTATAFMSASILHKEYGWRSPWFSIGGYTAAALTGVSRLMNNKHWMTDVMAGAAIGIGSVHLGYFLADKIFKEKGIASGYTDPKLYYDSSARHYVAELMFGQRFIIGAEGRKEMGDLPIRGGVVGVSTDIPIKAGLGLTARASASAMIYNGGATSNLYSTVAGGYWNFCFAKILELQAHVMAGCAWQGHEAGADLAGGVGLSLITDPNFKIKVFADFESISLSSARPWLNTVVLGWSSAWFW